MHLVQYSTMEWPKSKYPQDLRGSRYGPNLDFHKVLAIFANRFGCGRPLPNFGNNDYKWWPLELPTPNFLETSGEVIPTFTQIFMINGYNAAEL